MQFPKSIKINQWDLPANKLKPPKVITFDAYNTLYSTTLPVMEQYCKIGLKYGIEADPQHLTVKFPKIFKDLRASHPNYGKYTNLTPNEWWETLISNIFEPIKVPKEMITEILKTFEGFGAYTVYPDLLEFLKNMRAAFPGTIFGVVSNTDPIMHTLIKNIGLAPYFGTHVYLSYDLEVSKPDPKIFEHALSDIVTKNPELLENMSYEELKKRCWHIGDERLNDMSGASNAGWNGVLIDRMNKYKFLGKLSEENEREEYELYKDKIDNNSQESWKLSLFQTDAMQIDKRQFVISNFNTLSKMFLS
ncbi:LAFE_0C10550g1_1 [Lachancea fermentati]|uniref:LAFE_0C10550g1_1 n=1 Tax=Lachancea fermentati TaxID=4955 RepID=A0A1G4MAE5_LACFM|nr:LAFE_0C10550g1_1 [Lachancea fermentati]